MSALTDTESLDLLWTAMADESIWVGRYGANGSMLGVFHATPSAPDDDVGEMKNTLIIGFDGTRGEQLAKLVTWLVARRLT
jgi:hypothetical protein